MKYIKYFFYMLIVAFIVSQFIPVDRTNPQVTKKVKWDSEKTEAIAKKACYDCHSNETIWPWYSYVAPIKFIVVNHVNDGRKHLNFSTGNLDDAHESAEELEKGKMPMKSYTLLHSEANLSEKEKNEFIIGLKNTFGTKSKNEHERENH